MLTPGALAVPPLLNQSPVATGDTWLDLGFILYISFNYFRLKKKKRSAKSLVLGCRALCVACGPFKADVLQVSLDSRVPGCVEVQAVTPAVPFSPVFLCGYFEVNLFSKLWIVRFIYFSFFFWIRIWHVKDYLLHCMSTLKKMEINFSLFATDFFFFNACLLF